MANYRARRTKIDINPGNDAESSVHSFRFNAPARAEKPVPAFLGWPFYLFEKLAAPWRGNVTSVVSTIDGWRVGNRIIVPKSEMRETDSAYHYVIELPNVARDQIKLAVKNDVITLRAETSRNGKRNREGHQQFSHSIRRTFSLPVRSDAGAVTAELKNGMLMIAVPKTDKPVPSQVRTIEVG